MALDIVLYVIVRQLVVAYERIYVWTGKPAMLRRRLRASKSYQQWKRNAQILDQHLGNSKWKQNKLALGVGEFDCDLIERTTILLRRLRIHHTKHSDPESASRLMDVVLHTGVKANAGGIENPLLYSHTYWGTKDVVEEYLREGEHFFERQHRSTEGQRYAYQVKRSVESVFGVMGLTSLPYVWGAGGAGFGYYHLGVIKALLDVDMDEAFSDCTIPLTPTGAAAPSIVHARSPTTEPDTASDSETYRPSAQTSLHFPQSPGFNTVSLLPSVFTGTSAGSLIAAMVCVRTDEELRKEILVPDLWKKLTACQEGWMTRMTRIMKEGSMFDNEQWIEKTREVIFGDITFLEAYRKTGRILNISVIPEEPSSPPKVLNYLTSPDVVIWSAVLASSAVPFVLRPVELIRKAANGELMPFRGSGRRWRDGSLRVDIPEQLLHRLFNVNYTVLSGFTTDGDPRGDQPLTGKGKAGKLDQRKISASIASINISVLEQWFKLDIMKYLQLVREMALLPR
ncbi:hypothetical protein HDU93_003067, partial [Gonapodya sp. JEL0774]